MYSLAICVSLKGDGGPHHDRFLNAQNLTSLLGKVIRIDVNGDDFPLDNEKNYAIPPDNPFVHGGMILF
jgi:hypothetical protein